MITMDMNGITWIGDIYQKFEAMCLEVEEVMYQDTVKYVENQVQTVGASVKKFYSDVMQDLLPPSSEDSAKRAVSELPVDLFPDLGIYMKPKVGVKDNNVVSELPVDLFPDLGIYMKPKVGVKDSNVNVADKKQLMEDRKMSCGNLLPLSQDSSRGALRQRNRGRMSNRVNVDTYQSCKLEIPSYKTSRGITRFDQDSTRSSMSCVLSDEKHETSLDKKASVPIPGSVQIVGNDLIEENRSKIETASEHMLDASTNELPSGAINSIKSDRSEKMDIRDSVSGGLVAGSKGPDSCENNGVASFLEFSSIENEDSCEFPDMEDFASNSGRLDGWSTDLNEDHADIARGVEIVPPIDEGKIEESCILVSGDEFQAAPPGEGTSRAYKKKIRNVFSSKKRSMRKQEYEQLAVKYGGVSKFDQEECLKFSTPMHSINVAKGSPANDCSESEWELL